MAENLITAHELAVWTGKTDAEIEGDDLALDIMKRMSEYARFLGFAPADPATYGWQTRDETPFDVKLVVLKVCRRSYDNPAEVVQEGNVGPIGGDRVRDTAALAMELTETERATIAAYNVAGDPTGGAASGLWVQPFYRDEDIIAAEEILYVGDDQQINLSTSPDPREWKIPLFNPGDPGSDPEVV